MKKAVALALLLAACTGAQTVATTTTAPPESTTTTTAALEAAPTTTTTTVPTTTTTTIPDPRPDWLGTRPLPLRPDGYGEVQPTPPELAERAFPTDDLLPPPQGSEFGGTIQSVPEEVLARSTWTEACPVTPDDLAYLTLTFWGFDGLPHTGEMIVNGRVADDVVSVFSALFDARFPIEEMRVMSPADLEAPRTGDRNNTSSFECRKAVGSGNWSRHAYGLAIDLNPFQNPYQKGDLVLPELASAYLDREWVRPGMIFPGDAVTGAFEEIGWQWGGEWTTLIDLHHFSVDGR